MIETSSFLCFREKNSKCNPLKKVLGYNFREKMLVIHFHGLKNGLFCFQSIFGVKYGKKIANYFQGAKKKSLYKCS